MTWTLGPSVGAQTLRATISNRDASVEINATAQAAVITATISKTSGDAQTIAAGATSAPMLVTILDLAGNPVAECHGHVVSLGWYLERCVDDDGRRRTNPRDVGDGCDAGGLYRNREFGRSSGGNVYDYRDLNLRSTVCTLAPSAPRFNGAEGAIFIVGVVAFGWFARLVCLTDWYDRSTFLLLRGPCGRD